MSWTKQQLIDAALDEIGIASYTYDISSDQYTAALRRLDTLMETWNAKGIRLGYPIPSSPESSSLTDESNIPDNANEAVILALAVRLAPSYGKTPSPDTKVSARSAYIAMLGKNVETVQKQLPVMPSGAGNKAYGSVYYDYLPQPTDPLETGPDGVLEIN